MKNIFYNLLWAGLAATLVLGACDKDDLNNIVEEDDTPPTVLVPADPDPGAVPGAVIADPPVLPSDSTHYPDGHYRIVQRSTESNAFTLIVVGDGFGFDDMRVDGYYDSIANILVDGFQRNYVIRDYLQYFNIVVYYAHSSARGVGDRFGSNQGDDKNGMISNGLRTLATTLTGLTNLTNVFTIMPNVGNIGASPHFDPAGSGLGWAPYPYDAGHVTQYGGKCDFYWMIHEFCGHVIGRFPDMYTRDGGQFMTATRNEIDAAHTSGNTLWMIDYNKDYLAVGKNVKPDSADIFWSRFLYEPGYRGIVGIHAGAFNQVNENIFVPQPDNTNGMCSNGVNTYDAPSRYQMWRRFQKTVGRDYSLDRFFAYDTLWNTKQTNYRADPPVLQ